MKEKQGECKPGGCEKKKKRMKKNENQENEKKII